MEEGEMRRAELTLSIVFSCNMNCNDGRTEAADILGVVGNVAVELPEVELEWFTGSWIV